MLLRFLFSAKKSGLEVIRPHSHGLAPFRLAHRLSAREFLSDPGPMRETERIG